MRNCYVLMGEGSRIGASGSLKLVDVHMQALYEGEKHDGVKVYGQPTPDVSFVNSPIKDATTGIYVTNWFYPFGNNKFEISTVHVTNCETAIEAYQGNIDLSNVHLSRTMKTGGLVYGGNGKYADGLNGYWE